MDGWGIAQIDRSFNRRQVRKGKITLPVEETVTSTAETWNWKESVRAMNKKLREKKPT